MTVIARICSSLIVPFLFLYATATPAMAQLADDPACIGKTYRQLCQTTEGVGGMCMPARCGEDLRPCFQCEKSGIEDGGRDDTVWIPMIAFGFAVFFVGLWIWFRLRRFLKDLNEKNELG